MKKSLEDLVKCIIDELLEPKKNGLLDRVL